MSDPLSFHSSCRHKEPGLLQHIVFFRCFHPFNKHWLRNYYPQLAATQEDTAEYDLIVAFLFIGPILDLSECICFIPSSWLSVPWGQSLWKILLFLITAWKSYRRARSRDQACGLGLPNLGCSIRAQGSSCRLAQRLFLISSAAIFCACYSFNLTESTAPSLQSV